MTHQGAGYFIAAPQGGGPGDIRSTTWPRKVQGVFIEADVLEFETDNGQLHVIERYFVHNTSTPPQTQWSQALRSSRAARGRRLAGAAAQRPSGLPTSVKLDPDGAKGHYTFNFPIQPDQGDKDTLFQLSYTVPYSSGKFTFKPEVSLPAENVGVLLPKSMTFAAGSGATFQPVQEDPGIQTFWPRTLTPGKTMEFTISGTGSMPREQQGGQRAAGRTAARPGRRQRPGNQPGGGIGAPINTPDPLTKYKWWILGGLALLLAAAAAFLLRKPAIPEADLPLFKRVRSPRPRSTPINPAFGITGEQEHRAAQRAQGRDVCRWRARRSPAQLLPPMNTPK